MVFCSETFQINFENQNYVSKACGRLTFKKPFHETQMSTNFPLILKIVFESSYSVTIIIITYNESDVNEFYNYALQKDLYALLIEIF